VQGVSDFVEGIGNIGSTWVFEPSQNIKVVTVSGAAPTAEKLRNKSYPFYRNSRLSHMVKCRPRSRT